MTNSLHRAAKIHPERTELDGSVEHDAAKKTASDGMTGEDGQTVVQLRKTAQKSANADDIEDFWDNVPV